MICLHNIIIVIHLSCIHKNRMTPLDAILLIYSVSFTNNYWGLHMHHSSIQRNDNGYL